MTGGVASFDLDEWSPLAHKALATIRSGTGILGFDDFDDLLSLAGRVPGPQLLAEAWKLGRIDVPTLAATISGVWSGCEYPNLALDHAVWRKLFQAAGYTRDGKLVERPTAAVELWRGSPPAHRRGWSWTTDRAMAERFAHNGMRGRSVGRLYRTVAPPSALLCESNDRDESEFVVDTYRLRIAEAKP